MHPTLLSDAALFLAQCLLEKSAAARPAPTAPKPAHPRRQHMARPMPVPAGDDHAVRHIGQFAKETPGLGLPHGAGSATAKLQRTPQYLQNSPGIFNKALGHTLAQTAAGRAFGQTGVISPGLVRDPGRAMSSTPGILNLMRAMQRAGIPDATHGIESFKAGR